MATTSQVAINPAATILNDLTVAIAVLDVLKEAAGMADEQRQIPEVAIFRLQRAAQVARDLSRHEYDARPVPDRPAPQLDRPRRG